MALNLLTLFPVHKIQSSEDEWKDCWPFFLTWEKSDVGLSWWEEFSSHGGVGGQWSGRGAWGEERAWSGLVFRKNGLIVACTKWMVGETLGSERAMQVLSSPGLEEGKPKKEQRPWKQRKRSLFGIEANFLRRVWTNLSPKLMELTCYFVFP